MKVDTCGCCEPNAQPTPATIDNRPSLSAVSYRVGTFTSFRQAMLQEIAATPELAPLKTRLSDDYAITVLEMWAIVADVLTFYQERIVNEGFLRTARLRDSVLRLARLLDYELGPGAAATTLLAFSLEKDAQLEIPVGLRVQSVPQQEEQPQKFETLESIQADARLNRLRILPAPVGINPLAKGRTEAILAPGPEGLAVLRSLSPDSRLLIFNDALDDPVETKTVRELRIEADRIVLAWTEPIQSDAWTGNSQVFQVNQTYRAFGHDAPQTYLIPVSDPNSPGGIRWHFPLLEALVPGLVVRKVPLDALYDDVTVGSRLVADVKDGKKTLVQVTGVDQTFAKRGPLSGTVTQLEIDQEIDKKIEWDRQSRFFQLVGPPIRFWGYEYPERLASSTVYLPGRKIDERTIAVGRTIEGNEYQPGVRIQASEIEIGRKVILLDDQQLPTTAVIADRVIVEEGKLSYLELHLQSGADLELDSRSAVLLGNVAPASHGETIEREVIGDGDAAAKFQRFELKKSPVTFVPSAGPGGIESSLRVLVNRVLWSEAPTLFGQTAKDQVYTTRMADDGTMTVQFGDGTTGARLPSGRGNVVARYRQGLGLAGRVPEETLTSLLDRPVGLKSATNPVAADGSADPETIDDARQNAPGTVRTFGRAVSLRDFEDLVRTSGEVAKARATWVWNGLERAVHLTVAAQQGGILSAEALSRIHASLNTQRDPNHRLFLDNFVRVPVVIAATIHVAETRVAADVEVDARAALLEVLSFEVLQFGQPLHLSDIYRVLQDVNGVEWVDIDRFHFKDQSPAYLASRGADSDPLQEHLRIYAARPVTGPPPLVLPAEQAFVEVPSQDISIVTSGGLPS